jgi:hypothetical protein
MTFTDSATDGTAAFSRPTGLPAHMGKKTSVLKGNVPDCVKEDVLKLGRECGMTESELICQWAMEKLYGLEAVISMDRERRERASGLRPQTDPKRAAA